MSESRNDKEIFENAYVFYVSDSDKLGKRMRAKTIQLQPQTKVVGTTKLDNGIDSFSLINVRKSRVLPTEREKSPDYQHCKRREGNMPSLPHPQHMQCRC